MFRTWKLSPNTVTQRLAALRFLYIQVLKRGWSVAETPYPKKVLRLPQILSQQEVGRLIDAAETPFYRVLLMTLYATGARRAEVTRLKITDIDSERMVVHIRGGKGRKDRDVMLSQALLEELRVYWRGLKKKPTDWLFPGNKWHTSKRPITTKVLWMACQQAAASAGLEDKNVHPHTLRHCFATHLLEAGADLGFQRFLDREDKDRDLAEEIQSHLAHEMDANLARGLSDTEARRQARLKFGNPLAIRERVWNYGSLPMVDSIWRDFRYAWRSLTKAPGFTTVAVLVIALGIGVNTAVFSVVNTVLLQPLPYPDPQSLVRLVLFSPQRTLDGASVPEFNLWHQQTGVLREVAGYDTGGAGMNLTGGDHPMQVQAIHVTHDYFTLFGAPVIAGRTFTQEEDTPHGGNVVVLSYGLWKQRFGGDANIVGRTIQLDNTSYLVVGVLDRRFVTDNPADLWIPYQFDLNTKDMAHYFGVAARLQPGVTIEQGNAQLKLASDQFRRAIPNAIGPQNRYGVVPLKEWMIGDTRTPLLLLLSAVGLVLLIACANVANLLLARASVRKREFATRAALGAGRWHVIRQLLSESLLLSVSGGLFGLLLGYASVRLLLTVNLGGLPRLGEYGSAVALDMRVLLFTLGLSMVTGILFGLVPAVRA